MKVFFKKMAGGVLVPANDETAEWIQKKKTGAVLSGEFVEPRNYGFHKKAFELVKLAFGHHCESFGEGVTYKGIPVEPDFERFREDMTILAGYYTATFCITGEVKLRAKSWAFGSMGQEEFEKFYSALINVALKNIYRGQYSEAELQKMVNDVLGFA